jgi:release factor glutamine methyltransferase
MAASPTATLAHVPAGEWSRVYEPAEDSWLLSDAVCSDAGAWLRGGAAPPALVLELGSGSGAVCTSVLLFLQQQQAPPAACLACDVSPFACRVTAATAAANGVGARLDVVQCDLLDALRARLRGAVDLLLFNPPYVPTPSHEVPPRGAFAVAAAAAAAAEASEEEGRAAAGALPAPAPAEAALDTLPAAWAGGENGREVIDRALPLLQELLRRPAAGGGDAGDAGDAGGTAYLLLLEDNDPKDIARLLAALGLATAIVARRQAPCESLLVMRVQWAKGASC